MPAYVPPHLRGQQTNESREPPTSRKGKILNRLRPIPAWRRGAFTDTAAASGPVRSYGRAPTLSSETHNTPRRGGAGEWGPPREHTDAAPPFSFFSSGRAPAHGPGYGGAGSTGAASCSETTPAVPAMPAPHFQTAEQAYRYSTYERTALLLQPRPIKAGQCDEKKEYAQWAGGFVEINDKLFSCICPCNMVGKPCPFDELPDGCPMIRLCNQLEKWTIHQCPDKGFRTILEDAENVPVDYGDKGFGTVNYYESSDSEGGVPLDTGSEDNNDEEDGANLQPSYRDKKVSFNDFSCGVENACGHIHWEVEINCRFVGWARVKDIPCKQVLEKGRLCSCGHDLESARQEVRNAVKDHERAAERAGAPRPRDLGKAWVY